MKTCTVDGCCKREKAAGLCSMHYARMAKHGSTDDTGHFAVKVCSVDGCEKKAISLGLCSMHRQRLRKHGETGQAKPLLSPKGSAPICGVEGCGGKSVGKGLCRKHYTRMDRHGSVDVVLIERGLPLKERIINGSVKTVRGCWEWQGSLMKSGYASIHAASHGKRFCKASRASWFAFKGEIPTGMLVLHSCDNRKCVNPEHLFLGDHQDNMNDMKEKGREGNGKLTPFDVIKIRRSSASNDELAALYNVSRRTIYNVKNGVTYTHI